MVTSDLVPKGPQQGEPTETGEDKKPEKNQVNKGEQTVTGRRSEDKRMVPAQLTFPTAYASIWATYPNYCHSQNLGRLMGRRKEGYS